jgi:hypothetical protein
MRKAVYPEETRDLLQSNSSSRGLKKTPKDQNVSPRVRVSRKQAATTNQP